MMGKRFFIFLMLLLMLFPVCLVHAEKFESEEKKFSIEPPAEWMQLPLGYESVAVSYGKKGTLATFHISARDLEDGKTLESLKWEDLFSPEFNSIDIHTQGVTMIGGKKARFCIYC